MRRLIFLLLILAATPVESKTIVIYRGLGGQILQPMVNIGEALRKRGNTVVYDTPTNHCDVAIGHSLGGPTALATNAKIVITIDPVPNQGCLRGSHCINFYSMLSQVSGAHNIHVNGDHVNLPNLIASRIINEASQ